MEYKAIDKDYEFRGDVPPPEDWHYDLEGEQDAIRDALDAYTLRIASVALENITTHWGFNELDIMMCYQENACMTIPYKDFLTAMVEMCQEYIQYEDTQDTIDGHIEDLEDTIKALKALKK